ncbi:receptor-like protein 9DC3 [Gossypium hirsutum]|uniref:Receptor-like protein 9DC3 n=1 Tax=Gossypium hirsutum TaxID=3635 RepID=A0A1U8LYB6_GOSHI|nr:receptor-like protein 9DC3 [Gossypium hirsutum]
MLTIASIKFNGTIPPTFVEECHLSNLNLNGNQLEGSLSPSILNCRGLEVLDLGNNKINDTFPHWLGSLPQLQVLVLKSNQMHGSLHEHSSKSNPCFSKIQIFDLSSNYFSGPLPVRYIESFKAIIDYKKNGTTKSYMGVDDKYFNSGFYTYSIGIVIKGQDVELVKIFTMWMIIDLSNNMFEGGIPKVIGKLSLLKGLNLSHNNLNGGIPTSIGNLTSLEWLDLSSNRLSGTIPNRLTDLAFLTSLNVSENQLHGQIPQGKQFNTFGNDSYEGNKGLCGFPVSKGCNIIEPPPPNVLEKDGSKSNIAFGWKVVLIGYGCGVVFGMAMGYVVFQIGSHSCSHPEAASLIQFKNSFSITQTVLPAWYCDEVAGLKSYIPRQIHGRRVQIAAHGMGWLFGNFPSNTSLFLLPHLQKLNPAFNNFNHSKIPSEFGRFTGLLYLNLSYTGFVGVVPSQVSHLSKLVSLDLSWIDEQLTIDKYALEGLVHNLTVALKYLDLSHSYLSGPRSLGNLLQLTHLDLGWNKLRGQIPLSILNLTHLEYLKIAENSLESSISDEVCKIILVASMPIPLELL